MTWFNVVDDATGRLISAGSEPIDSVKPGRVVIKTESRDGVWNESTRQYDRRPESDVYIPMREYLNRFTNDEYIAILAARNSDPLLNASYERLKLLSEVKINGARTKAVLAGLEAVGILAPGRAAEILRA